MYIKKNYDFFKFNLFNFKFFHNNYERNLYLLIYNNIISIIVQYNIDQHTLQGYNSTCNAGYTSKLN